MARGTLALTPQQALARLVPHILEMESQSGGRRIVVGIAGGPGVGKSTLAGELVTMLNAVHPGSVALVPMDGFHLPHAEIEALGLVKIKGAPQTFDGAGFVDFLGRLKHATETMSGPGYSRKIEDVVADAFSVAPEVRVLVVEGNYLLLADGPWGAVKPLLDYAVFLHVPRALAQARLLRRHAAEGLFSEERNRAHVERCDLPNYDLVEGSRGRADVVIEMVVER